MIVCAVCNESFKNMITWRHLKHHNLTSSEYKEKYGPVVSEEFRKLKSSQSSGASNPNFGKTHSLKAKKKISDANKGKTPSNYNSAMTDQQKEKLSTKAKLRNEEWHKSGTHPLVGSKHTAQTKEKIAQARKYQIITNEQVQKALATKKANGTDLAFFRGKVHSEESKQQIAKTSKLTAARKQKEHVLRLENILEDYNYQLIEYTSTFTTLKCTLCGTVFSRTSQYLSKSKIRNDFCSACYPKTVSTSKLENQLADFVSAFVDIERNNRTIISPLELDVVIPGHNLAIEFNGLYWHSTEFKEAKYHLRKSELCAEQGIKLIHVFEDEWVNTPEIVKSRLLNQLGKCSRKVYARKTKIRELTARDANQFLKINHIQSTGRSNVRLGLYHNDTLVSVMTFLKGDVSKRVVGWELNRFCTTLDTTVVGGANKLFNYFVNTYSPEQVTSFADRRWSNSSAFYSLLGFTLDGVTPVNYWYFAPGETQRKHRYSFKTNKYNTEKEQIDFYNLKTIYDCGSYRFLWCAK